MTYFSLRSVSNSNLQELRRTYYGIPFDVKESILNFGSLVDALLTEAWRCNHFYYRLDNGRDLPTHFTPEEWAFAVILADRFCQDPIVRELLKGQSQKVFQRKLTFEFDGQEFTIEGRCKYDSIRCEINIGCDYKTTACATQRSFIESIDFLNYDQAAAWYMDIAEIDRFIIIAISKKTKEIFRFAIQRGDSVYERGRSKYSFWAYRWLQLIF